MIAAGLSPLTLGGCATIGGQQAVARASASRAVPADDDLPSDMGAPLTGVASAARIDGLSIEAPIAYVAGRPAGRAVLERDLPGLCERPEFVMFKSLSLKTLASMSHGRITPAKLNQVQADLIQVDVAQVK